LILLVRLYPYVRCFCFSKNLTNYLAASSITAKTFQIFYKNFEIFLTREEITKMSLTDLVFYATEFDERKKPKTKKDKSYENIFYLIVKGLYYTFYKVVIVLFAICKCA